MDTNLTQKVLAEVEAMCHYATANGYKVPPKVTAESLDLIDNAGDKIAKEQIEQMAELHHRLSDIVAPAKPQTLKLILDQKRRFPMLSVIGSVPIVRHIMLASLSFLAMFVVIGQLDIINTDTLHKGILETDGWVAIMVLGYLVSCAGLGACFASLYRLNTYLSQATYDSRYDSTYWASILLGVISGLFISELLASMFVESGAASISSLGKPALALVGGFSANMVYKVLQRVVDTIESLFKGDSSEFVERELALRRAEFNNTSRGQKMSFASALIDLEKNAAGKSVEEIGAEIRKLAQDELKRD